MRVSSLSDDRIIDLLTKYFVPVWVSRQHYQLATSADSEQDELRRIDHEQAKRGLEGSTVCVYILAPDGGLIATMPVGRAANPDKLAPFLQKVVDDQKLAPRAAEDVRATKAGPRPAVRPATEGGAVLHVCTRLEDMKNNRGLAQDWVEWKADEWSAFAPAVDAKPGAMLAVPREAAERLFQRFYPPSPRWGGAEAETTGGRLTVTVVAVEGGEVRLRLEGEAEVKFPVSIPKADGKVKARLVGAARYDLTRRVFTSFTLTSESAEYASSWEGKGGRQKMQIAVELEP